VRAIGERHGNAKLSEEQVLEVHRLAWAGDLTQRQIAVMFKISQNNVHNIKYHLVWRWLLLGEDGG
jgi:hypothetical protein